MNKIHPVFISGINDLSELTAQPDDAPDTITQRLWDKVNEWRCRLIE